MIKTYKGIEYIVYWFEEIGIFNGYVKLPEKHLFQKFIDKTRKINGRIVNVGYDEMEIDVHGGLTFTEKITLKNIKDFPQGFSFGSWIGWDYGHFHDTTKFNFDGRAWTEKEVEQECQDVIDQLLDINVRER